jgi:hypothetical protein
MYSSGIDLHSDNCYITTLDDSGAVIKQQRFNIWDLVSEKQMLLAFDSP